LYHGSGSALARAVLHAEQFIDADAKERGNLGSMGDSEQYLLTCMRYIELNPVRARDLVGHPADYPWSSYACNALGLEDALIKPHLEYRRLGKTAEERQAAYRQLFRNRIGEKVLDEIREATNKAWVLGSERFKRRIAQQTERPVEARARGGDRKSDEYRKKAKINRV
jgi:putative transposase